MPQAALPDTCGAGGCLRQQNVCPAQNKNSEFCAPLTSFDWNETDLNRLGTSSIDTTCTIWDIEVRPALPSVVLFMVLGVWLCCPILTHS